MPPEHFSSVCTYIKEVSRHAAAVALLVPVSSLTAGAVEMPRLAAVVAVLVGTFTHPVPMSSTKEAG